MPSGKKTKNEKCHARHMVWPWLSSARKNPKQKMSCTPYNLAVASISKKEGEIKKCHTSYQVWPLLPMGKNFKEKQKMSRLPYGLAHQKKQL
jgi:hypothetical protein